MNPYGILFTTEKGLGTVLSYLKFIVSFTIETYDYLAGVAYFPCKRFIRLVVDVLTWRTALE